MKTIRARQRERDSEREILCALAVVCLLPVEVLSVSGEASGSQIDAPPVGY